MLYYSMTYQVISYYNMVSPRTGRPRPPRRRPQRVAAAVFFVCLSLPSSLPLSLSLYIYICISISISLSLYIYMYVCMYIYIYIL